MPDSAADVEDRVRAMYDAMGRAFQATDPTVMREYYAMPWLRLGGPQALVLASTAEESDQHWRTTFSRLPADYDHSVCDTVAVQLLNPATAMATVSGARYRANGEEIAKLAITLILTNESGVWRVAVSIPRIGAV